MNSYMFLFIFLVVFFIAFPIAINYPPKRISSFFHRKQSTPSYPKFVSFLLAISMVIFNTIYFACFHYNIGIVISSVAMFCLLSTKYSVIIMQTLRENDKRLIVFAFVLLLLALMRYTFPLAIIMALVLFFACLMPKSDKTASTSDCDADPVLNVTTEVVEPVATSVNEEATTDMPSSEVESQPSANEKQHSPTSKRKHAKRNNRSSRSNRHSNKSMYKRYTKPATSASATRMPSKLSHKSNQKRYYHRHD